jgi:hypothetical protein
MPPLDKYNLPMHAANMRNDGSGGSAVGVLVLAVILAVLLSVGIPILLAPEKVKLSDWLGFAGSLAGALVALIAAGIAWRTVQHQIEANKLLTERQESAALNLACSELRLLFDLYGVVWRVVDIAMTKAAEEQLNGVTLATTLSPLDTFVKQKFDEIRPYTLALHPLKRWQLHHIERYCLSICTYIERNHQPAQTNLWLMSVRTRLTYLAIAVEEFSSDFLRTFHGHIRQPLDATSEAEMHKPLVDQYEQVGHI